MWTSQRPAVGSSDWLDPFVPLGRRKRMGQRTFLAEPGRNLQRPKASKQDWSSTGAPVLFSVSTRRTIPVAGSTYMTNTPYASRPGFLTDRGILGLGAYIANAVMRGSVDSRKSAAKIPDITSSVINSGRMDLRMWSGSNETEISHGRASWQTR